MPSSTCPIENIIVVMLENRSYDNVLGWLYGTGNAAPFDKAPAGQTGLNGLSASDANPNPSNPGGPPIAVFKAEPTVLSGLSYPATTMPVNDPGEIFKDMAQQFTGAPVSSNPYGDWPPSDPSNLMQGFTANYLSVLDSDAAADVPDVMSYLTPQQLPITGFLANQFAVADQWYASVPTQTFTNRVFSVCAAPAIYTENLSNDSYSIIDDIQYGHAFEFDELLDLQSVFSALDTAMPNVSGAAAPYWKLYYHDYSITAMTVPYVLKAATASGNQNVAPFNTADWGEATPNVTPHIPLVMSPSPLGGSNWTTFAQDIANGTLPAFSLIEPRYADNVSPGSGSHPPNSNHPGVSNFPSLLPEPVGPKNAPIDAANGELLLWSVYSALRGSGYWEKTLLIVTYDEPGGMYDHCPPVPISEPGQVSVTGSSSSIAIPAADTSHDSATDGFTFNVSGGRVPAIVISPYIMPGSTIDLNAAGTGPAQPFDHTTIIKTVWEVFDLAANGAPPSLTDRDAGAPSLVPYLQPSAVNFPDFPAAVQDWLASQAVAGS